MPAWLQTSVRWGDGIKAPSESLHDASIERCCCVVAGGPNILLFFKSVAGAGSKKLNFSILNFLVLERMKKVLSVEEKLFPSEETGNR